MSKSGPAVVAMAVYLVVTAVAAACRAGPAKAAATDGSTIPVMTAAIPELQLMWTRHFGSGVRPFLSDGTLYVVSGRTLSAIDAATGHGRWRTVLKDRVQSDPLEVAGTVAVLVGDDHYTRLNLTGFSAASGKKVWTIGAKAGYWADEYPLVSKGSTIYFEDRDGNLYAVDSGAGKLKWSKPGTRGQNMGAFPIVADEFVVWNDGNLSALDAKTGIVRWTANCAPRYAAFFGATPRTALLTTTFGAEDPPDLWEESTLCGIDLHTGAIEWHIPVRGAFGFENGICAVSNGVMLACQGKRLVARNVQTGQEVWTDESDFWPSSTSVQTDGTTVCFTAVPSPQPVPGEPEGAPTQDVELGIGEDKDAPVALRALDLRTGKLLWERPGRSPFYPVAVRDGLVYVYDEGRRLLVVDARSGEPKWQTEYAPGPAAHGSVLFGRDMLLLIVENDVRAMFMPGLRQVPRRNETGPNSNVGQ